MIPPIEESILVSAPPRRAFDAFVRGFDRWWPPSYTWSGEALQLIVIEPFEGGRCVEIGPDRFTVDWGRVVDWAPPDRLAFTWQISADRQPIPDRDRASVVEVTFDASDADTTRVALRHRAFERHGEDAAAYRDALAADQGWPFLLERYRAFVADA